MKTQRKPKICRFDVDEFWDKIKSERSDKIDKKISTQKQKEKESNGDNWRYLLKNT